MKTFKELLGTENKKEQVERIEELLLKEDNPKVTLQIGYDGIADQVTISTIGGDISFDKVHRMLELTRRLIRKQEISQLAKEFEKKD